MMKHDRRPVLRSPILIIDFDVILGRDETVLGGTAHAGFSQLMKPSTWQFFPPKQAGEKLFRLEAELYRELDNFLHARINLLRPAAAGEHAVMADPGLHMVALQQRPQVRTEI